MWKDNIKTEYVRLLLWIIIDVTSACGMSNSVVVGYDADITDIRACSLHLQCQGNSPTYKLDPEVYLCNIGIIARSHTVLHPKNRISIIKIDVGKIICEDGRWPELDQSCIQCSLILQGFNLWALVLEN
jgi:hypothetical protein